MLSKLIDASSQLLAPGLVARAQAPVHTSAFSSCTSAAAAPARGNSAVARRFDGRRRSSHGQSPDTATWTTSGCSSDPRRLQPVQCRANADDRQAAEPAKRPVDRIKGSRPRLPDSGDAKADTVSRNSDSGAQLDSHGSRPAAGTSGTGAAAGDGDAPPASRQTPRQQHRRGSVHRDVFTRSVYREQQLGEMQLQAELAPGPVQAPALPATSTASTADAGAEPGHSGAARDGPQRAPSHAHGSATPQQRQDPRQLQSARVQSSDSVQSESTAMAAALAGVEPAAVEAARKRSGGRRRANSDWGRVPPPPHALMRLQNSYEVSAPPRSALRQLLGSAIPQLDREEEVRLTRVMREGEALVAAAARLASTLGRPATGPEILVAVPRSAAARQLATPAGMAEASAQLRTALAPGKPPGVLLFGSNGGQAGGAPIAVSGDDSAGDAAAGAVIAAAAAGLAARHRLRDSQLRLVVRIAARYQYSANVALEDLVQEGLSGLEAGLDKFEPRRGGRLTTAIYWYVHTAVARGHAVMKDTIVMPHTTVHQLAVLYRTRRAFAEGHGRRPTVQEMAAQLDWSEKTVRRLFQTQAMREASLDAPSSGNGTSSSGGGSGGFLQESETLGETLSAQREGDADVDASLEAAAAAELARTTEAALRRVLKPRDVDILVRLFGLDGAPPELAKKVAVEVGVSHVRIGQIKQEALRKLRADERFLKAATEMSQGTLASSH